MDLQFEAARAQMQAHTDLAVQREGLLAARSEELAGQLERLVEERKQ